MTNTDTVMVYYKHHEHGHVDDASWITWRAASEDIQMAVSQHMDVWADGDTVIIPGTTGETGRHYVYPTAELAALAIASKPTTETGAAVHYSQQDIMDQATDIGEGWSKAVVKLGPEDTAYHPSSSKSDLCGPGTVTYLIHPSGWQWSAEATEVSDRDRSHFATSYPILTGDVVLQGHADYCAAHGHAYHMTDGVIQSRCPRCGDLFTKVPVSESAEPVEPTEEHAPATPQDTVGMVFGSGGTFNPWWVSFEAVGFDGEACLDDVPDEWVWRVTVEDIDPRSAIGAAKTVDVDHAAVMRACTAIASDPKYRQSLRDVCQWILTDSDVADPDAGDADAILQVVVFGEIIYG